MKRVLTADETADAAAFLTNLNLLVAAHGVMLDSESPIFFAVSGAQTPFALVMDDQTGSYDIYVDAS